MPSKTGKVSLSGLVKTRPKRRQHVHDEPRRYARREQPATNGIGNTLRKITTDPPSPAR